MFQCSVVTDVDNCQYCFRNVYAMWQQRWTIFNAVFVMRMQCGNKKCTSVGTVFVMFQCSVVTDVDKCQYCLRNVYAMWQQQWTIFNAVFVMRMQCGNKKCTSVGTVFVMFMQCGDRSGQVSVLFLLCLSNVVTEVDNCQHCICPVYAIWQQKLPIFSAVCVLGVQVNNRSKQASVLCFILFCSIRFSGLTLGKQDICNGKVHSSNQTQT